MLRLANLFVDGAVVQREMPIVVWGWCAPRVLVTARLATSTATAPSSLDGRFEVRLPSLPAGGPYELEVVAGEEKVVVKDVLVGEVWLASGQSNMEFPLATFNLDDPQEQTDQYLAEGGVDPLLRMVTVPHQSLGTVENTIEAPLSWVKSGEDRATTRAFSAVGAWFALALRKQLGVPVGIIHSSWGGTYAHAWTSREMLRRLECRKAMIAKQDADFNDAGTWSIPNLRLEGQPLEGSTLPQDFDKVTHKDTGNQGFGWGWAAPEFDDSGWKVFEVPGSWKVQGVAKLGALWARLAVELPPEWAGLDVILHLGGIDKHDQTYFNGELVGATGKDYDEMYWNRPREYRIPGRLVKGGRNVLANSCVQFLLRWCVHRRGGELPSGTGGASIGMHRAGGQLEGLPGIRVRCLYAARRWNQLYAFQSERLPYALRWYDRTADSLHHARCALVSGRDGPQHAEFRSRIRGHAARDGRGLAFPLGAG